ncbi:hypothetical protein G0U57_017749 [Chelydra serpentina]|uniref:Uncharacterized protein n=1 Tax=Chelydra serpentina TaxID=8475 RepID=A0A8T1SZ56_CHESE|nr:hypothetical protein G0U57_017749 [Chelydra serpentina]
MKILYLLSVVVFLVLLTAPEFSQARLSRKKCRRRGGSCHLRGCPFNSIYLGKCWIGSCCQSQIFD